jgi:hypothetical protein
VGTSGYDCNSQGDCDSSARTLPPPLLAAVVRLHVASASLFVRCCVVCWIVFYMSLLSMRVVNFHVVM